MGHGPERVLVGHIVAQKDNGWAAAGRLADVPFNPDDGVAFVAGDVGQGLDHQRPVHAAKVAAVHPLVGDRVRQGSAAARES